MRVEEKDFRIVVRPKRVPAGEVEPTKLGSFGRLGWTSWSSPNWASSQAYRCDTRFHPAERMRMKRERAALS